MVAENQLASKRTNYDAAPSIISANAIFITRSKLFLRSLFFSVKRTIASKVPPTVKTASITIVLQIAVSSVLEGNFIVDDAGEVLVKPAEVDIFSYLKDEFIRWCNSRFCDKRCTISYPQI